MAPAADTWVSYHPALQEPTFGPSSILAAGRTMGLALCGRAKPLEASMSQCHDTYDPIEQSPVLTTPSNAPLLDGAQCHDTYEDKEPASPSDGAGTEQRAG